MASWGTRGVATPTVSYHRPATFVHPLRCSRPRRRGRRESRVVARVFSARMEQLAQFVSKSFDNAAGEHAPCRTTTERPPSARITLSVAHLLGDSAENDGSTSSLFFGGLLLHPWNLVCWFTCIFLVDRFEMVVTWFDRGWVSCGRIVVKLDMVVRGDGKGERL